MWRIYSEKSKTQSYTYSKKGLRITVVAK